PLKNKKKNLSGKCAVSCYSLMKYFSVLGSCPMFIHSCEACKYTGIDVVSPGTGIFSHFITSAGAINNFVSIWRSYVHGDKGPLGSHDGGISPGRSTSTDCFSLLRGFTLVIFKERDNESTCTPPSFNKRVLKEGSLSRICRDSVKVSLMDNVLT